MKCCIRKKRLTLVAIPLVAIVILLTGCANGLSQKNKQESYTYTDYKGTILYKYAEPYAKRHPNQTGFYPLGDGQVALLSRIALIESAQKSLDFQYYIYSSDQTGHLIAWYLYQAAERGVRVRVLLDDMQNRDDAVLASLSAHPNIELRLFNPFSNRTVKKVGFINDFKRVNRRMHNKAIVADGSFAITGGRNIADEYFSASFDLEFGDLDLLLAGTVVSDVAKQFDLYWNSEPAIPIENIVDNIESISKESLAKWKVAKDRYLSESSYAQSLKHHPFVKTLISGTIPFYWTNAHLTYDLPEKALGAKSDIVADISAEIAKAQKEFFLISPYFVPTEKGTNSLINMVKRGVRVVIVTNSLASNDVYAVHGWYAKYREDLLKGGVDLYETKVESIEKISKSFISEGRSSLHAKSFILDKNVIFVGSFNFDPRSANLNTELGVFVESPKFANLLITKIEELLDKTAYRLALDDEGEVRWLDTLNNKIYESDPHSSLLLRMGAKIAGFLPIEGQL